MFWLTIILIFGIYIVLCVVMVVFVEKPKAFDRLKRTFRNRSDL